MVFHLLSVLPNGDCLSPLLPNFNEQPFGFPLHASVEVQLRIVYPSDAPYDIKPDDTFILTLRPQGCCYPPGVQKTVVGTGVSAPMTGKVTFSILPADTRALCAGAYVYDIWMVSGAGARNPLVPLSALRLQPSAALP